MPNTRLPRWTLWLVTSMLVVPMTLPAQVCGKRDPRPWLGVHTFYCQGGICKIFGAVAQAGPTIDSLKHFKSSYRYEFSVEPSMWGIHPHGPSAGKLEDGDVLVAVNGRAVTTAVASEELDGLQAGRSIRVTIRRRGRLMDVRVTPTLSCEGVGAAAGPGWSFAFDGAGQAAGLAAASQNRGDQGRPGPVALGVAIRCSRCVMLLSNDGGGSRFRFEDFPEVAEVVAGSPAERAGLRPGDLLTHLDGNDIRTKAGAERLAGVGYRAGDTITLRYLRGAEVREGAAVLLRETTRP